MLETTGLDAETVNAWMTSVWGEGSVQAKAGARRCLRPTSDYFTKRAWRAAEVPAANMVADARSVARMYAATVSEVDGIRLLIRRPSSGIEVQTDKTRMHGLPPGLDLPADRSFYMSLGFWRSCPPQPMLGPNAFGHPGSGGSIGFADPDAGVGFGYVMNLWSFRVGEPRASSLSAAVKACLG